MIRLFTKDITNLSYINPARVQGSKVSFLLTAWNTLPLRTIQTFTLILKEMANARKSSAKNFRHDSRAQKFMPAEWERHQCTLTAFPNLAGASNGETSLNAARHEVAAIANAISEFEPVWLYAKPSEAATARSMVNEKVIIKETEVDDLWIRDFGPVFVRDRDTNSTDAAVDFNFNYWGGRFEPTMDHTFARRTLINDFQGVSRHQAGIVSEGGALEVDGEGTLLVTDSSIINENRNLGKSKEEIETHLRNLLGVHKIIWLRGVKGLESTDWHIDAFARFVEPGYVILSQPPKSAHPAILDVYEAAIEVLKSTTDAKGRLIQVTSCPEPDQDTLPGGSVEGMVTSYVNYLLVNNGLILARFGEPETDEKALELIRRLFPTRQIAQVHINELPRLGGGIHCATQHVPAEGK